MELAELCAELESILSIKESLITKMQSIMTQPINHHSMEDEQTQLLMQKLRESQKMQIISSETVHRLEESLALLRKQEESLKVRKNQKVREKQELTFKLKYLEQTAVNTDLLYSQEGKKKLNKVQFKEDNNAKQKLLQSMKKQLQFRRQQNQDLISAIQKDDSRIETEQDSLLKHYQSYNKLVASAEELKAQTRNLQNKQRQLEVDLLGEASSRKTLIQSLCNMMQRKEDEGWEVQIHKNQKVHEYLKNAVEQWLQINGQYQRHLGKITLTIDSTD